MKTAIEKKQQGNYRLETDEILGQGEFPYWAPSSSTSSASTTSVAPTTKYWVEEMLPTSR
jgi:hypothetical protein